MKSLSIALYGIGNVGRELLKKTLNHTPFRYIAITDASGTIVKKDGFDPEHLKAIVDLKEKGDKLREVSSTGDAFDNNLAYLIFRSYRPDVLVDVSTAQSYSILFQALSNRIHIVGSNKRPYSDTSFSNYRQLFKVAEEERRVLDNRTVVSANLGVLPRIAEFTDTGGISRVEGCLSGTMAYVSYRINQDIPFSKAVSEAREMKYTEPDERDDLLGKDFVRKTIIIGRRVGVPLELGMIKVEDTIPEEFLGLSLIEFRTRLPRIDEKIRESVRRAQEKGCMYRFIGTLDFDVNEYTLGFKEIPKDHPQANVQGCFNKVTIYPRVWEGDSLTIEGPGAGLPPTVQGLVAGLNEILKIGNLST